MIRATVTAHVAAPAGRVIALYADPAGWASLFPDTIRGARVIRVDGDVTEVEVDHRLVGRVRNRLRRISPTRVDLEEWKPRYDAVFSNEFLPDGGGTRYVLGAEVRAKGWLRLAEPLAGPLVRARLRRWVVEPLRRAAEARGG